MLRQERPEAIETLSFAPPPSELTEWYDELERLMKSQARPGAGGSQSSFARGAPSSFGRRGSVLGSGGGSGTALGGAEQVGATALFAGWLEKKGGGGADGTSRNWAKGGRRNWKKRWMVVSSNQFLSWYDHGPNPRPKDLKGSLALHGAQVSHSERAGGLWVLTNSRSLELQAESKEAADRWIGIIQEAANQVTSSVRLRSEKTDGASRTAAAGGSNASNASGAVAEPPPPPPPPPKSPKAPVLRARALYDYQALNDGEISLTAGEVFDVLSTDSESAGWWFGLMGEEYGYFPANYVELLDMYDSPSPARPPPSPPPTAATTATAATAALTTATVQQAPVVPPPGMGGVVWAD